MSRKIFVCLTNAEGYGDIVDHFFLIAYIIFLIKTQSFCFSPVIVETFKSVKLLCEIERMTKHNRTNKKRI